MQSEGAIRDYLKDVARRLDAAAFGEAAAIKKAATEHLGINDSTLYRMLHKQVGWTSGRKARKDKGTTKQDLDALAYIASQKKEGVRKNGKVTKHTPVSVSIAKHNNFEVSVSAARVNRLLKDRKMDHASQRQANAAVPMRSLYPNHTHQIDPSLCLVYYAKGEQHIISDDEFYKNKPENFEKIVLKCWRYVLTDHASNWTVVRYYAAKGENTENLFDFMMYAWGKKEHIPFLGVPKILIWDKGSANGSATIKNLLDALDVNHIAHTKGNARAKGSVEQGNNRVECQFECRLKSQPIKSVDELNTYAEAWMVVYNGNLDPHQDTRLNRNGRRYVRTDLWLKIQQPQLRFLPDIESCKAVLLGGESSRKVKNLKIQYKHPKADRSHIYLVDHCDGICDGDTVFVRPMLFGNFEIDIKVERYDGEDLRFKLEPMTDYDEFGQRMDGRIFGETHHALAETVADKVSKRLDRIAYPNEATHEDIQKARDKKVAPHQGMNELDYIKDIATPSAYLPKKGTDIPLGATATPEDLKYTGTKMIKRIIALNHGAGLSPEDNQRVKAAYPNGMTDADIKVWLDSQKTKPQLRAVG